MDKSIFTGFMEKLLAFPLWIKQTIFLDLSKDLNTYLAKENKQILKKCSISVIREMQIKITVRCYSIY